MITGSAAGEGEARKALVFEFSRGKRQPELGPIEAAVGTVLRGCMLWPEYVKRAYDGAVAKGTDSTDQVNDKKPDAESQN